MTREQAAKKHDAAARTAGACAKTYVKAITELRNDGQDDWREKMAYDFARWAGREALTALGLRDGRVWTAELEARS